VENNSSERGAFRGRESAHYNLYLSESDRLRAHCSGNPFLPLRGKKDWSGKPGFWREAPKMRPNSEYYKNFEQALDLFDDLWFSHKSCHFHIEAIRKAQGYEHPYCLDWTAASRV
jgi:hypothetical protein